MRKPPQRTSCERLVDMRPQPESSPALSTQTPISEAQCALIQTDRTIKMSADEQSLERWKAFVDRYLDATNRSEAEQAMLIKVKTFEQLDKMLKSNDKTLHGFGRHVKLIHRLKRFTQPFNPLSDVASSALSPSPFPPASTLFGAVSFLIQAANGVSEAYEWVDRLLDRLENFTGHLNEYFNADEFPHLASKVVQILGFFLEILARFEKIIKTGRYKIFVAAGFLREDEYTKASFEMLCELFDDEKQLVTAIHSAISQRSDEGAQETEETIQDVVPRIKWSEDREVRGRICTRISTIDFSGLQDDTFRRRQDGTGLWFLGASKFQNWVHTARQTLFCPGMKGAGKTIIAATVIDYLSKIRTDNVGLAYVFYQYKSPKERIDQSMLIMLSAILKQLTYKVKDLPESIYQIFFKLSKNDGRPTTDEIFDALKSVSSCYSHVYIVVDALDVCDKNDRFRLISKLRELQIASDIRFLITSRNIHKISHLFKNNPNIEVRANEDDIKLYITSQMDSLAYCIQNDKTLQTDVLNKVAEAAGGMFLIADLHIKSLCHPQKPSQVRSSLESMKFKNLEDAYAEAIMRIDQQASDDKELAWHALSWIVHAMRPLKTRELCNILSLEPGACSIGAEDFYDIEDIISVCAGLVTVDKSIDIVRLTHYTTQEYLEGLLWRLYSELDIARDCVKYLSLQPFLTGSCSSGKLFRQRLKENPFLDYSALYWSEHVRSVQTEIFDSTLPFLCNDELIDCTSQAASTQANTSILGHESRPFDLFTSERSGLHLTVMHGLVPLTKFLIDKHKYGRIEVDSKDDKGQTPLSLAAEYGHEEIVELLLATGNVEINSVDKCMQTPLIHAAKNGMLGVVKLLIERRASVEWKEIFSTRPPPSPTALWYAAFEGHEAVVQWLLDLRNGVEVDIEASDEKGRKPLAAAAFNGHSAVVKRLLETQKVNPGSRETDGATPLHTAAYRGHEAVVRLLLDAGADPDPRDKNEITPLALAAQGGHRVIVEMLLVTGKACPDSRSKNGQTALSRAAAEGHDDIVQQLLDTHQVDPDPVDESGETPLYKAAEQGHTVIVKRLIDTGRVNPDPKNIYGWTPLYMAAFEGLDEILEMLLDERFVNTDKVNPDAKDDEGKTPLDAAASNGHREAVKMLLDKRLLDTGKVNPNSQNDDEETPLFRAVLGGCAVIVHMLLDKRLVDTGKVDPNLPNIEGWTPLYIAAEKGYEGIVKLFLAKHLLDSDKVNLDSMDKFGKTPLRRAVEEGHEGVVRLLLNSGRVDPNLKDKFGSTPLSRARYLKHGTIVELMQSFLNESSVR